MDKIIKRGVLTVLSAIIAVLLSSGTAYAAYWSGTSEDCISGNTGSQTRTVTDRYYPSPFTSLPSGYAGYGISESNGHAYYTCGTCGGTGEVKSIKLYGYTDRNGTTEYTGWCGYVTCPNCHPNADSAALQWSPSKASVLAPVKKAFTVTTNNPGNSVPGVYTLGPMVLNANRTFINYLDQDAAGNVFVGQSEHFTWTTDPGVPYNYSEDVAFSSVSLPSGSSAVSMDEAKNFIRAKKGVLPYILYNTSGMSTAIKVSHSTYQTSPTTGFHPAYGKRQYINVAYWVPTYNTQCIHHHLDLNQGGYYKNDTGTWVPHAFETSHGMGIDDDNCGQTHQRGFLAVCADCGEVIPLLTYMTSQTAASINKIPTGMDYVYTCPVINDGNCGHAWGQYFKSRPDLYTSDHAAEQWAGFSHTCANITCRNQYKIQFVSNIPDVVADYMGTSPDSYTFTESGYFYGIYRDGEDVYYSSGGTADATWGYIKSKNTINQSAPVNHEALIFDGWYTSRVGGTRITTWEQLQPLSSAYLNLNEYPIPLYAHWTIKSGTLKTVDSDGITPLAPFASPESILWGSTISVPDTTPNIRRTFASLHFTNSDDGVTTACDPEGAHASNGTREKIATFAGWVQHPDVASFTGRYDKTEGKYTGFAGDDTLKAEWNQGGFILPTPDNIPEGYAFVGWTEGSGDDHSHTVLIPAGSSVTGDEYFAHYVPVEMFIYANKRTTDASGNPLRYEGEQSDVWWRVSNINTVSHPYYKIYQHGAKDIEGVNVNTTTNADFVNTSGNNDQNITIPYDGYYAFVLNGGKGGNGNASYVGGNGGKEEVTLFLKQGDVVKLRIVSGGTATNGITSATAGSGGAGSLLYVRKAGTTDDVLVAAAGGGGGGAYSTNGGTKGITGGAGGTTEETVWSVGTNSNATVNGSATSNKPSGFNNPYYSTPYYCQPGGGYGPGGTYGRISANYYTHTCNCSTSAPCGHKITWSKVADNYFEGGNQITINGRCDVSSHNTGGSWDGTKAVAQGYYFEGGPDNHVGNAYWIGDRTGSIYWGTYGNSLNDFINYLNGLNLTCNVTVGVQANHTAYQNKWYSAAVVQSSTGGKNYYNNTFAGLISHASTSGANSGAASWSVSAVVSGLSDTTDIIANTPDLANPPVPVLRNTEAIRQVEYRANDNGTISLVLNFASWYPVEDLGSDYYWNGETYGDTSPSVVAKTYDTGYTHTAKSPNASPAELKIISGIKHYWYVFDENPNPPAFDRSTWSSTGPNTTVVQSIGKVMKTITPSGTHQSGVFYLHVRTEDYAENISETEKKIDIPWVIEGHIPGNLKTPEVSIPVITDGVYKKTGSTDTYYVKADGETSVGVKLYVEMEPTFSSRITLLGAGNYFLTSDYLTRAVHTGGVIGSLDTKGAPTTSIVDKPDLESPPSSAQVRQAFTTQKEDMNTLTAYAESKCTGQDGDGKCHDKDIHDQNKSGNTIYIIGDKTAPGVFVNNILANDGVDLGLIKGDEKLITIRISDTGSGVKSYVITDIYGNTIKSGTEAGYSNESSTSFTWNKQGAQTIIVTVKDNVGNERTIEITITLDGDSPVITDESPDTPSVGKNPDDSWREYDPENDGSISGYENTALWEYDWVPHDMYLRYRAVDRISDISSFKMYASDSSWTKGALLETGEIESSEDATSGLLIEHTVTTEGRTYYILEAEDTVGHITTVHIVVRIDKSEPLLFHDANDTDYFYKQSLSSLTPEQATAALSDAGSAVMFTKISVFVYDDNKSDDKTSQTDDCGIKSATLVVNEVGNPANLKEYPMAIDSSFAVTNTDERTCPFAAPAGSISYPNGERKVGAGFSAEVNFFADFADAAELEYNIVAYDNVDNVSVIYGKKFANFDIKAVDYMVEEDDATHSQTVSTEFNVPTSGGISNVGYYKTGEWGFVEVWTVGKVDSVRFDFGVVGEESFNEVDGGALAPKYLLGWDGNDAAVRRINSNPNQYDVPAYGVVEVSPGSYASVAMPQGYARHYVFKGSTLGAENTEGWLSDGTNIMIPPNYQLQVKRKPNGEVSKDAAGNAEYEWEYRIARVYAEKARSDGSMAETYDNIYYVIWDGAGDDLHYRVTHETPGTESFTE